MSYGGWRQPWPGAHAHGRTRQIMLFSHGMLDAVGRTDWTCLGTGPQLTREGSWWGKGGWGVATMQCPGFPASTASWGCTHRDTQTERCPARDGCCGCRQT
eukprot:938609-Rhodomonas_salina.1